MLAFSSCSLSALELSLLISEMDETGQGIYAVTQISLCIYGRAALCSRPSFGYYWRRSQSKRGKGS